MRVSKRGLLAVAAVTVVAGAPAALAAPGGVPGKPSWAGGKQSGKHAEAGVQSSSGKASGGKAGAKGKRPNGPVVTYVFVGTYAGDDVVDVVETNKHARSFAGGPVSFDFSAAKVSGEDANGDEVVDLADVAIGDNVKVKSRMPKRAPASEPLPARQLVFEAPVLEPEPEPEPAP